MKATRVVEAMVAGVGLTAAVNRVLTRRAGELEPALEGRQESYRWRGMDVAYTEAGDPDAPTLVFFHGTSAAASNGEFRNVFTPLAQQYHVVAPDLPGFGRSDRPSIHYTPRLYEAFVESFLSQFDAPTVVTSSLSAAFLAGALDDVTVSRLVLACPSTGGMPGPYPWLERLVRLPVVGTGLFNLAVSRRSIERSNADHGYYDMTNATEQWLDYEWRTAHQPGARFAPAAFVSGQLNSDVDLEAALSHADVPVTLVWGRDAETTPLSEGRELADATGASLVVVDEALLLPHVEHPDEFVEAVMEAEEGVQTASGTTATELDAPEE